MRPLVRTCMPVEVPAPSPAAAAACTQKVINMVTVSLNLSLQRGRDSLRWRGSTQGDREAHWPGAACTAATPELRKHGSDSRTVCMRCGSSHRTHKCCAALECLHHKTEKYQDAGLTLLGLFAAAACEAALPAAFPGALLRFGGPLRALRPVAAVAPAPSLLPADAGLLAALPGSCRRTAPALAPPLELGTCKQAPVRS